MMNNEALAQYLLGWLIGILLFFAIASYFNGVGEEFTAAIKDSGCSTHPHKVIEQKDIQIKDTYVKWEG